MATLRTRHVVSDNPKFKAGSVMLHLKTAKDLQSAINIIKKYKRNLMKVASIH